MPNSLAPPESPRSRPARARPTATGSTAAATARSTPRSTASPSPAPAAIPRRATTSPNDAPKVKQAETRSAASSATSPAASGTYSSRPTPDQGIHPHQFLDIGAAGGVGRLGGAKERFVDFVRLRPGGFIRS